MLVIYCAPYSSGEISPFTTTEFVDREAQVCFPMDTDILKDASPPFHSPPSCPKHMGTFISAPGPDSSLAYKSPVASVKSHDCGSHVLGRSSVLHQKVNHALRLDEQVAAQKEDAEHYSQGEDTEDCDLHHPRDVEAPLIGRQDRGAAVGRQHRAGPVAAGHEHPQALGPVGVSSLL